MEELNLTHEHIVASYTTAIILKRKWYCRFQSILYENLWFSKFGKTEESFTLCLRSFWKQEVFKISINVPVSLPFTVLIVSYFSVTERRIVPELQSIFALQSPFMKIEMRMGILYQKL